MSALWRGTRKLRSESAGRDGDSLYRMLYLVSTSKGTGSGAGSYGIVMLFDLQVPNSRLSWNVRALQRLFVAVPRRWQC